MVDLLEPANMVPRSLKMESKDSAQHMTENAKHSFTAFLLQNHLLRRVFSNSRFWPNTKSEH